MTSIPEMSNDKLDRKIAKLRGDKGYQVYIKDKDHVSHFDGYRFPTPVYGKKPLPFTTDPRYAMELLKEMENVTLNHFDVPDGKWQCACSFLRFSSLADTPERAIAEAYAEWMEIK